IATNGSSEVIVDVTRRIVRSTKDEEEDFLAARPVEFSQDGNTITIQSRAKVKATGSSRGQQRTEGHYVITVPAQFSAQLKTSAGAIPVGDLTGEVTAGSNGGALGFVRLHGPLDGSTAGGAIRLEDCEGTLKVKTSGGAID